MLGYRMNRIFLAIFLFFVVYCLFVCFLHRETCLEKPKTKKPQTTKKKNKEKYLSAILYTSLFLITKSHPVMSAFPHEVFCTIMLLSFGAIEPTHSRPVLYNISSMNLPSHTSLFYFLGYIL